MRRVDRLFQIIQMLRRSRVLTAAQMAERLEVSERTIYRDIEHLSLSGVPILGEKGVGYRMRKGFDLPPLMLDARELQALMLGARMVSAWADEALAEAAATLIDKIETILPDARRHELEDRALFVKDWELPEGPRRAFAGLRQAIETRSKVMISYQAPTRDAQVRTVRPLGLFYFGGKWLLASWCELRQDWRAFRVDRITSQELLDQTFETPTVDEFIAYQRATHLN